MQHNYSWPLHGRQVVASADQVKLRLALIECSPRITQIAGVEKATMASQRVAPDVPTMKEQLVCPELSSTQGRYHCIQQTGAWLS